MTQSIIETKSGDKLGWGKWLFSFVGRPESSHSYIPSEEEWLIYIVEDVNMDEIIGGGIDKWPREHPIDGYNLWQNQHQFHTI